METPVQLNSLCKTFDDVLARFGTSRDAAKFEPSWRAFAVFAREAIECDDESLFFEAGVSPSQRDRFYVHFTRTVYAREGDYVYALIINCDFLFALTPELKQFAHAGEWAVEADELSQYPDERGRFLEEVEAEPDLWNALSSAVQTQGDVYVGEG